VTCATVADYNELEAGVIDGLLIGQSLHTRDKKFESNAARKWKAKRRSVIKEA